MKSDYEKLLEKAKASLPKLSENKERFEIPRVKGHIQGNKTIVSNFNQIITSLGRDSQHLLKYLQRELATPASIDGPRLILNRKISSSLINSKIEQYVNIFVLCPDCKKPDTKLMRENKILVIKCMACGAKHPIKSRI